MFQAPRATDCRDFKQPSRLESYRPVALEYDPAGHGAQTDDDVAPAVGSKDCGREASNGTRRIKAWVTRMAFFWPELFYLENY